MPSKYAEFLKAQGASEDELKILDTPVAAKAFDKMQADVAAERTAREATEKKLQDYQGTVTAYYDETNTKFMAKQNELITARAEADRFRGALQAAQDQGLLEVAENLLKPNGGAPAPTPNPTPDPQYINRDDFLKAADQLGDNLARLEDMVMEHRQLFPDTPLRVSDLRREALAARKTVPEFWEEKYKVRDAREAQAKAAREAEQAKWKAEGAKEKETEFASRYGNPDMRPMVPSTNPFTPRKDSPIRTKQPWDQPDGVLSNDRVKRATEHAVKNQFQN